MNEIKKVEILWTGGYDSTFRIIQLSKLPVEIQPYYISDTRKSENMELLAINRITEELKNKSGTLCSILPLVFIEKSTRASNSEIIKAYKNLRKTDFMGSQYEWLGSFSKVRRGIELSIHKDDKAVALINKHGLLKKIYDPVIGDYFIIDEDKSKKDLVTLFGSFHFPLYEYTKLMMLEQYNRLNCRDIMNMTWFCYNPINNQPCGTCNPCKYTIEEGLSERFTSKALKRYEHKTKTRNKG